MSRQTHKWKEAQATGQNSDSSGLALVNKLHPKNYKQEVHKHLTTNILI